MFISLHLRGKETPPSPEGRSAIPQRKVPDNAAAAAAAPLQRPETSVAPGGGPGVGAVPGQPGHTGRFPLGTFAPTHRQLPRAPAP